MATPYYLTSFLKSHTDAEYTGIDDFKRLISLGIVSPEPDEDTLRWRFTLDQYCYTGMGPSQNGILRAHIYIDQLPFTAIWIMPEDRPEVIVKVAVLNKGKVEYRRLNPPQDEDNLFSFYCLIAGFLSEHSLGYQFYEYVERYTSAPQIVKIGENWRTVITEYDKRHDLVYFAEMRAKRGTGRYGCKNRSTNYAPRMTKAKNRVNSWMNSSLFGGLRNEVHTDTIDGFLIATLYNMIESDNLTDASEIIKYIKEHIKSSKLDSIPVPTEITTESVGAFCAEYLNKHDILYGF